MLRQTDRHTNRQILVRSRQFRFLHSTRHQIPLKAATLLKPNVRARHVLLSKDSPAVTQGPQQNGRDHSNQISKDARRHAAMVKKTNQLITEKNTQ